MMKFFAPTALLAAVALTLATPGVSDACGRGCGHRYRCWESHPCWQGYGCGYRTCDTWIYCGYRSYCYAPCYGSPYAIAYTNPVQRYASTQHVVADNTASIRVTVPAGATVWFDDNKTTQTGSERLFESPPLTPGRHYSYDLKAQWRDQDGKEVTQTRHVDVSANASVSVEFGPLAAE